jgi:hypothetical protein
MDGRPQALVRAPTVAESAALKARESELQIGLAPYRDDQSDAVEGVLATMLNGYRTLARARGQEVKFTVASISYRMRPYPFWAIAEGCDRILDHKAGLDPAYAAHDPQIVMVIEDVVAPYRLHLRAVTALLAAPIEAEREKTDQQARQARPAKKRAEYIDGKIGGRRALYPTEPIADVLRRISIVVERMKAKERGDDDGAS